MRQCCSEKLRTLSTRGFVAYTIIFQRRDLENWFKIQVKSKKNRYGVGTIGVSRNKNSTKRD